MANKIDWLGTLMAQDPDDRVFDIGVDENGFMHARLASKYHIALHIEKAKLKGTYGKA